MKKKKFTTVAKIKEWQRKAEVTFSSIKKGSNDFMMINFYSLHFRNTAIYRIHFRHSGYKPTEHNDTWIKVNFFIFIM